MADTSAEDEKEEIVEDEEDLEDTDKEEDKVDEDKEVPVRKGNADFARTRLALKDAKKEKESASDDEVLTDKAKKLIEEEVERRLAPITSDLENKTLLREHFVEHPEHKKYENKAQKYMAAHPTLTVQDIFKIIAPAVEPDEKEKAEDKAKRGSMTGTTVRKGETKVAQTHKELQEVYNNVKRGNTKEALKSLGIKN